MTLFAPISTPIIVQNQGLSHAKLSDLPAVYAVAAISLAVTLAAIFIVERAGIFLEEARPRFTRATLANLIFVVFDVAIFSLLVYGTHYSPHKCVSGPTCNTYPIIWLALAWMHCCYFIVGCLLKSGLMRK